MFMGNYPHNADTPATKGDLDKLEEKIGGQMKHLLSEQTKVTEQLLADQVNVILDAVDERMEKKLDQKLDDNLDPVISKLDGIMKGVEALQQENVVGAEQLRRHDDQLQRHETRIIKLETAQA